MEPKTVTLPPMTKAQWYRLPAIIRYFHPWARASRPLVIDTTTKRALEPKADPTPRGKP
jgi:hypothetical protein